MLIDVTTGLPMVRSLRPVTVDDVKAIEEEQSMSVVRQPPPMSFEAYLAWEAEQSERHEFLRGEVFAMTGARATHNTIAGNIFAALKDGLRGTPCRVFIAYMKLHAQIANADGLWVLHSLGADDAIDLTPLGLSLPVASLYEGVEFGNATAPSNRLPR